MKRILVTGALGFCGAHLCRFFSQKPGYEIFGTYFPGHNTLPRNRSSSLKLIPIDIRNPSSVDKLIRKIQPQFLFHLAAQSSAVRSKDLPDETFLVNVGGTLNLLRALREWSPQTRMLFASSAQVYGETFYQSKAVHERDLLYPQNPYAATKVIGELACQEFVRRFNLKIIIARPFNHFGTGQTPQFVFSDWCRQIALAEAGHQPPVITVGNIKARRDFLHVQDVVKAYECLIRKGGPGKIYNIATGKAPRLEVYLNFLLRRAKRPLGFKIQKQRLRKKEVRMTKGRAGPLRRLGWKPCHTPFGALEELLDEWRLKTKNGPKVI